MDLVGLPHENRAWLLQWLSEDEIDQFFQYDNFSRRHVFAHNLGEDDEYLELRSVNKFDYPKVRAYGEKPTILFGPWKETGIVVLVEDIVSAIKVGRSFGAMPMFGSYLSPERMSKLAKKDAIKHFCVWTDEDKWSTSIYLSRTLSVLRPSVSLYSERDPKYHNNSEIKSKVSDAILGMTQIPASMEAV
jgi:hypothetical protein